MKPALFVDRDGTLNYDCPYCKDASEIRMYEDIFEPLKKLSEHYYIIVISNQSGVARGYFSIADLKGMNDKVTDEIEKRGGRIDMIYYCPHREEDNCSCRKPKTGMIESAMKDFEIDRKNSFFIGDDDSDMATARNAKITSIRIRREGAVKGDYFAEDFYGVLDIINRYRKKYG